MQCGDLNQTFNKQITQNEIIKSIKQLKNYKASGEDDILNEFIKATQQLMLPLYEKSNFFSSGKVPSIWLEGNIMPIFKNKGRKTKPETCRPITILSCMGRLQSLMNA